MRLNFRGETIPEVLMVTLILGSVLSTAFALTSQVTGNSRSSQERSEASAYGQQQLERLKAQLNRDVPLTGNFCINDNNAVIAVGDPSVGGCPDAVYSRYRSTISFNPATQTYTASVNWENSKGRGQDNLQLVYRVEYLTDATVGPGGSPAPAPTPIVDNCPNSSAPTGALQACYYNDISFGRFISKVNKFPVSVAAGYTNALDDNFGLGSPSAEVDTDNFSGRYIGNFNFNAGTYVFNAGGDDGVRLYIDDNPVALIDEFRQQGYTQYSRSHTFTSGGLHKVRLEFYENRGYARATLSWGVENTTPVEAESFPAPGGASVVNDAAASGGRIMSMFGAGTAQNNVTIAHPFQSVTIRAKGDSWKGAPQLTLSISGVTNTLTGTAVKSVGATTYYDYQVPNLNFTAGTYLIKYTFGPDACGDQNVPCGPGYDRNLYVDKLTFNEGNRVVGSEPSPPPDTPLVSSYSEPGTFTVPAGKNKITVELWGAQGGGVPGNALAGGRGGYVKATINVNPGEAISINAGNKGQDGRQDGATPLGGSNGGGNGGIWRDDYSGTMVYRSGGGGGGCSDIRIGGTGLANRVLVAGGGGGANIQGSASGVGGYVSGSKGASGSYGGPNSGAYYLGEGGGGGTQTSGGSGGLASFGGTGQAGTSGQGGRGGSAATYGYNAGGGGGGGCGFFGGGGGGVGFEGSNAGTGGGGSTYYSSAASGVTTSNGVHTGDGVVKITY